MWRSAGARAGLVRARTALVNTARGLAKSYGERLFGCNVRNRNPEKAEGLGPELQRGTGAIAVGESSFLRLSPISRTLRALATITSCPHWRSKRLIQGECVPISSAIRLSRTTSQGRRAIDG